MVRLLGFIVVFALFASAQVRVWQDTFAWPAFVEGAPDLNPPFDQFHSATNLPYLYPYTFRIDFPNRVKEEQVWRALYIENEYLKCTILPDLGGHVYSCFDKIAKRDIFYANRSLRKQWVGLRGSWAAFGLELNFPIGHSWVSVSPVDFASQSNADGSASAWVGNVDRVTGMQWRAEFILRPGRAALEQRVTLENRSDVRHAYYWWSNAAVRLESAQDQFILPTNFTSVHGSGDIDTWPRSANKNANLDVVGNYKEGAGLFVVGSKEEFFGAYQPTKRAGLAHVAKFSEVPGKKTWTWGPDTWSNQNLSDDNSTYIEIQAGVLPSQEDHEFLDPQQRKTFTEYWIPTRNMSGISRATVDVVAFVGRASGQLIAELNVTSVVEDARIEIRNGAGDVVVQERARLEPENAWIKRIAAFSSTATLRVLSADGTVLLAHTEGIIDAAKAGEIATGKKPVPTWLSAPVSANDFMIRAIDNERQANLDWALFDYDNALDRDPASLEIRKHRGRLLTRLGQYKEAAAALAAPEDAGDPEARYYLALATRNLAKMQSLLDVPAWSDAAAIKAAEWQAAAGDSEGALSTLRVDEQSKLTRAGAIEIALLRALERWDDARMRLDYWLLIDPTNVLFQYEQQRLGAESSGFWKHLGSDAERVFNVAEHLIRLGQFSDALEVLEYPFPQVPVNEAEPGVPAPAEHPLLWYYRAFCRNRVGLSNVVELDRAAALSVRYVFPSRPGSVEILQGPWLNNRQDPNLKFLNALLLLSMRRTDEAIVALEQLRVQRPTLPSLHRTLGRIWLDVKKDKAKALPILQEGLRYEPNNVDLQQAINRAR